MPQLFDERMRTSKIRFVAAAVIGLGIACSGLGADTKIEQTLRDLDAQWSQAAGAKDVDKTVSFYSDDAIVLPPNAPALTTKEAIRNTWKELLGSVTSISWKATRVEVAKSGDMAYITGTYEMTMKDASGSAANDRGKYLEVWEKQADGNWKCGADMFSSDLPAPGEVDKK
jgi:ketosteroid isomerase-like protein